MIGKLTGLLEPLDDNRVLLNVNGVGYVVQCSARTLNKINVVQGEVTLTIETQVREDAITLIGFADRAEQAAFNLLTTVQGVGTRVALSILSTFTPEQLAQAIIASDKATLSQAEGVGPKLAARLTTELKDKAQLLAGSAVIAFPAHGGGAATSNLANDVVSTLANLGFRRDSAFAAVMSVLNEKKDVSFDELLKLSLQELGPKR